MSYILFGRQLTTYLTEDISFDSDNIDEIANDIVHRQQEYQYETKRNINPNQTLSKNNDNNKTNHLQHEEKEINHIQLQHNNFHYGGVVVSIILLSFDDSILWYQTIFVSFQIFYTLWIIIVSNSFMEMTVSTSNEENNHYVSKNINKKQKNEIDASREQEYKLLISSTLGFIHAPPPPILKHDRISNKSIKQLELLKLSSTLVEATSQVIQALDASIHSLCIESSLRHGIGIYSKSIARVEVQRQNKKHFSKIYKNRYGPTSVYRSRINLYEVIRQMASSLLNCILPTMLKTNTKDTLLPLLQCLEICENNIQQIIHLCPKQKKCLDIILSFLFPSVLPPMISIKCLVLSRKRVLLMLSYFASSIFYYNTDDKCNIIQNKIQMSIQSGKQHLEYLQFSFPLCNKSINHHEVSQCFNSSVYAANESKGNCAFQVKNPYLAILSNIEEFRKNVDALHVVLWTLEQSLYEARDEKEHQNQNSTILTLCNYKEDCQEWIENIGKVLKDISLQYQCLRDHYSPQQRQEHSHRDNNKEVLDKSSNQNFQLNESYQETEHKYYYEFKDTINLNNNKDDASVMANDASNIVISSEKGITPLKGKKTMIHAKNSKNQDNSHGVIQKQRIEEGKHLFLNDLTQYLHKRNIDLDLGTIEGDNVVKRERIKTNNDDTHVEKEFSEHDNILSNSRNLVSLELERLLLVQNNN